MKNGGSFEGKWEKDFILKGKLSFANGFLYEGEFKNNIIYGKGKL